MKKLLRKWLRKRIYAYRGLSQNTNTEDAFNWVYNSPIWEWRTRLFCIRNTAVNEEAKQLLLFLNK